MAVRILFAGGQEPALTTMAAAMLTRMLFETLGSDAGGVEVRTAGIGVRPGAAPDMNAVEVMREEGLDLLPYDTRPLTPDLVERSDLVLAMSTCHMDGAIRMVPTAIDKVFTLREFAGGRHMIERVLKSAGKRLNRLSEQLAIFDLPEPRDGSKEEYRRSREELRWELKKLVVMLIHDD